MPRAEATSVAASVTARYRWGSPSWARDLCQVLCFAVLTGIAMGHGAPTHAQSLPWGANLFAPSAQAGREIDRARAVPLTAFYTASASENSGKPGTLVRAQAATDFALPPGVTATRILYRTRTAAGGEALASAVVLVPYGKPPAGGWPLLAWSHGTSGVAASCAPSLMKSLFYDWEGLYAYVSMGYAVVATDYAGLGTPGKHAYLDHLSNATDVIHSVPAARAAVPSLGRRWIVVGHSQGGLSSIGVAELQARIRDPDFLGTVSLAGASDVEDALDSIQSVKVPVLNGLVAFWIYGIKALYPEFRERDVLTDKAWDLYAAAVNDGCSAASGAFSALATDEMLTPNWRENPFVRQFMARNRPAAMPTYGPLLLAGGATTCSSPSRPVARSWSASVPPEARYTAKSIPVSGMTRWSTGQSGTSWPGSRSGLPERQLRTIAVPHCQSGSAGSFLARGRTRLTP